MQTAVCLCFSFLLLGFILVCITTCSSSVCINRGVANTPDVIAGGDHYPVVPMFVLHCQQNVFTL